MTSVSCSLPEKAASMQLSARPQYKSNTPHLSSTLQLSLSERGEERRGEERRGEEVRIRTRKLRREKKLTNLEKIKKRGMRKGCKKG